MKCGAFIAILFPPTAPEGLQPLFLSNPTSTSIQVSFSSPLVPNGIISLYELTQTNQDGTMVNTPLNISALSPQGGQYVYTATGLTPYIVYAFNLTVCTGGGCTATPTTSLQTLQDAPVGLAPPTAVTTSAGTANVSWTSPAHPNGPLRSYALLRYTSGFQNTSALPVPTCCEQYVTGGALGVGCSLEARLPPGASGYGDPGLYPYTYYRYCIVAGNDVANASSDLSVAILTQAAPRPLAGPALNCTSVNSTAIVATWSTPDVTQLLGPLQEYALYGWSPSSSPSPSLVWPGSLLFKGVAQSFMVTGLMPSTTYFFAVSVCVCV